MGRRFAILSVLGLCLMSCASITSADTKGRAAEGLSIIIDKEVWTSDETFEATLGLWGLSIGRTYTLDWEIRTGNGTDTDQIFRSGTQNFTASAAARQLTITANHIGAGPSHLYRLITDLSDNSGTVTSAQVNFTSFTNSLPRGYSNIVFFGDSLSDMGNSYGQWGTPDSPPYWNGRYSNGEVWAEQWGAWNGVSMNPGRGSQSGNNRAYGGAHSGDNYYFVIPNVGQQVEDYLQNNQIGSNELVVIFCGGNDFVHSNEQNPQVVVDNVESHMDQLANAGAVEFLIIELPGLDHAPRVQEENDDAETAAFHQRLLDYNRRLHSMLDDKLNTTAWTIHRGMTWGLFDSMLNNPSYYGFVNTTAPACDHDGYTCDNNDPIASNAEEYVFFDKMHPTGTTHDIMDLYARQMLGLLDIDGDGIADTADACNDTMPDIEIGPDGCDLPPPDSDQDGVEDSLDDCPVTPEGEEVDDDGCALSQLDEDDDGVSDAVDICPNTAQGRTVNAVGCSEWQLDADNDGVVNALDQCPNTVAERIVDSNGCSIWQLDSDSDGISDANDACPNTELGLQVNVVGCATNQIDDDADGVSNADDICPNTASDAMVVGTVDENGCAANQRDTDSDGVNDDLDICPETTWLDAVNDVGCSAKQRDTDGDGPKDSDDDCPLIAGSIGGCPVLSIELETLDPPLSERNTANLTVTISCESDCRMNWTVSDENGVIAEGYEAINGTYAFTYSSSPGDRQQLTARVSIDGMWNTDEITIIFPEKEILDTEEDTGNLSNEGQDSVVQEEKSDYAGFELDSASIAMIAMLLLLNVGVVAAIMSVRSRSKKLDPEAIAASAFERSIFEDSMNSNNNPLEQLDTEEITSTPESELPDMQDLMK